MSFYGKDRFKFETTDITEDVVGSYLIGAGGSVISSTGTYLDVNVAGITDLAIYAEDSASASGDDLQAVGLVRQDTLATSTSADGDYGNFKSNAKGELYVKDADATALLNTIDTDTGAIAVSVGSVDTKLTATNALLTTIDADTGLIAVDTAAMVVDLAAIEVLLTGIDVDTDAISTNTSTIAGDTTSMDATLTALSKAEDAAHASGDQGIMGLAVANHTESALHSADGDYAPLQVDSLGRLRIIGDLDVVGNVADDGVDSGNPLKVGSRAVSGALTALSATGDRADLLSDLYRRVWVNDSPNVASKLSTVTVSTTVAQIAATAQPGRKRIMIQNLSTKPIYIGPTNAVTAADGIRINKNTTMELPWGPDLPVWAISVAGVTSDVRVLEIA